MMKHILFTLITVFLLSACGDFKKGDKAKASSGLAEALSCDFDVNSLKNILSADISAPLLCAESKLKAFVDVVETDRPGLLSLVELKTYLRNNGQDIDPKLLSFMDDIFLLKSLLYGESKMYMRKQNISAMVNLLIDINRIAIDGHLNDLIHPSKELSVEQYLIHKGLTTTAINRLGERLAREFSSTLTEEHTVNLVQFLGKVRDLLEVEQLSDFPNFLFIKRIILGGEPEVLTISELKYLVRYLPHLGVIIFDLFNFEKVDWGEEKYLTIAKHLRGDIANLSRIIPWGRNDNTILFSINDLKKIADVHFQDYVRFFNYRSVIKKVKWVFLQDDTETVTASEFKMFLDELLINTIDKMIFADSVYRNNAHIYDSQRSSITLRPRHVLPANQERYVEEINYVLNTYHLFKGDNFLATYTRRLNRDRYGVLEYLLLQDFIKKFTRRYGTLTSEAKGGYQMDMDQFANIVNDLKPFFIGEDLMLEQKIISNVRNITLLTTLFQYHSDGDAQMELDEMTEFLLTFFTGLEMSKEAHKYFQGVCPTDASGRYLPACFEQNFRNFIHETNAKYGYSFASRVPGLVKYISEVDDEEYLELMQSTEGFTRTCMNFTSGEPVPYTEGDLLTFFGGLLSVEQTLLRFDLDDNNVLEMGEIDDAYVIYRSAIEALLESDALKKRSKLIFLYLIRHRGVPDISGDVRVRDKIRAAASMLGFAMRPRRKYTPATRTTLSAILKTISEQSSADDVPFDCELLR